MQLPSIQELQPYLSALSLAALTYLLHLNLSMRQSARDRAEVIEERLKNAVADLERTQKWGEREKAQLLQEKQKLEKELEQVLTASGVTVEALAMGKTLEGAKDAIQQSVGELLYRMETLEAENSTRESPEWHLQLAKGFMARLEWAKAATHFDKYCDQDPFNSDVQFSRGVAHANTRGGQAADLEALRAYNEAIVFIPDDISPDLKARYFAYRGAMHKRLRRVQEALADLQLALAHATSRTEINDIRYNLAGVYAIAGDRENMIQTVKMLIGCRREISGIRHHLPTYFKNFSEDKEFLGLLDAG